VVANTRHGGNMNWDPRCERIWRRAVSWTDAVIFISEGVREFYVTKDRLSRRNVEVIYNGIDFEKFSSQRAQPGKHLPRIRFGAVGRLVPAKDHLGLVRAFNLIAPELPGAELHILGDGPCRAAIAEEIASLGLQDRVTLRGASRDVAGFLSTLDVFVLSSIDEGLPISIMEAMAAGVPVISTLLPGLPELAPKEIVAGYCPPAQPQLLSELMLHVARRSDLSAIGERSWQWARRFGIAETWQKYQGIFEQCLRKKRRFT
jgi:glycosyltransferase involved in cell wall biosynthesis